MCCTQGHRRRFRQFEEGQDVASAGIEEDVHVRIGRLGRGRAVFRHRHQEFHAQNLLVELDGFLRILAAIGDVVDLFDLHLALPVPLDSQGNFSLLGHLCVDFDQRRKAA
jgi:hypothetical protein